MTQQHLYATGIFAASCLLGFCGVLHLILRPRSPPEFPINKTGFYKRSKNFER